MKRIQSPTLMRLILMSFMVVAMPLIGAIATAIVQVKTFASEQRAALVSVQQTASSSRALADRTTELERTARQYHALADDAYKDLYDEHRVEVRLMFDRLLEDSEHSELKTLLEHARKAERAANKVVTAMGSGDTSSTDLEIVFAGLRDAMVAVVRAHNSIVRDLGNAMPQQATALQRLLMSQAALVIPFSVGLAVLFGFLIARPLRQIDQGIRTLGRGSLNDPIRVSGTRDLEELGRRLDGLRIRLLELEAQKAQFLRNVSHELKTPLTNIREGAELLLDDSDDAEESAIARILRDNSVRLQRMIEQLLRYGADGDLNPEQPTEAVCLDRLVEDVIEKQRSTLASRSVTLNRKIPAVVFDGNARRLRVIVDNLLSNAIRHTPIGGDIGISLHGDDGVVTLEVTDSGSGVNDQDAPHLFEWFYTGSRPPDSIVAGAGMGLAIAQEYAQQHDGVIESLAASHGARFRLTLREKSP
jgi:two-component system sensor histidine kinase GlrK